MARSIAEINGKIERGEATVLTSQEVCKMVREGEDLTLDQVDVVTCATRAIMSGTYSVLSFPVAKPGSFVRARRAWINGVKACIGPCPNERLGILDLMISGTEHSIDDPKYGGGHLFRDLAEKKSAQVKAETSDGKLLEEEISLEEIPYARIFSTRNAFKNYVAFVNPRKEKVKTIFNALDFPPDLKYATVSGCGEINPVKNDPSLETIGLGTRILLNGAQGFVIGTGTRSYASRPNLMASADMHRMDPEYMGGFLTSNGPECIGSWAVPIPVLSQSILESIKMLDCEISLPIMDVNVRQTICKTNYGDVWEGTDLKVEFDSEECAGCRNCTAEEACPMRAITFEDGKARRDSAKCFNCGLCISQCSRNAFLGDLGAINFQGRKIPIMLRQSDRYRAMKLAETLKAQISEGSFRITQMVEKIGSGLW
jgi:putative methanogenesis marker 16 metalloprotein